MISTPVKASVGVPVVPLAVMTPQAKLLVSRTMPLMADEPATNIVTPSASVAAPAVLALSATPSGMVAPLPWVAGA